MKTWSQENDIEIYLKQIKEGLLKGRQTKITNKWLMNKLLVLCSCYNI